MGACRILVLLVALVACLGVGTAWGQAKLLPLDPLLFSPLKADPLECRSGMLGGSTDLGGSPQVITKVGMRAVLCHFPVNPGMDAQFVGLALGQSRFDLEHDTEKVGEDWRYGVALQTRFEEWSYALELVHHSSHLGDEYMVRTGVGRIEYVQEEVGVKVSWDLDLHRRLYYGAHYAVAQSHVDSPLRVQLGGEWFIAPRYSPGGLGPYVAADVQARSEVDWEISTSTVLGWAFPGYAPGRTFDLVVTALSGPSTQRQFFRSSESVLAVGFNVDL